MNAFPTAEIFLLNSFADLHPQLHADLYLAFQKSSMSTGMNAYYGKDSKAYVDYLKSIEQPEFLAMIKGGMHVQRRDPLL